MTATPNATVEAPSPSQWGLGPRTSIGEVMTSSPHTIGCEQPLARAFDMMREFKLRHLPVVADGKLVGVLSQRDLYVVEAVAGANHRVCSVAEAMAKGTYTVAPSEPVASVARVMAEQRYGSAVVVDDGKVVGIFTGTDALALVARMAI